MTAKALLRGRCAVSRYQAVSDGAGGEVWTWWTITEEMPCHIDYPAGGERPDGDASVVRDVRRQTLFLPVNANVNVRDRIDLDGVTYEIAHIATRTRSAVVEVEVAEVTP